ncbi:MAG: ceramide glucosyltransferase [Thermoleophilia bacterium]
MTLPFETLLVVSLLFCGLQLLATWRHLRSPRKRPSAGSHTPEASREMLPPVSILKPISGLEDRLAANLESFFRLKYPAYELVFCFQDPSDPALPLVRAHVRRHPDVDAQIVVGNYRGGLNPKVCNLIPGYQSARHELILISDANVSVSPRYLTEAVSHLRDPRVGLVSHVVRGVGGRTLGADLDNGCLNTFIVGSVSLLYKLGYSCVIGKSMLIRRRDLEELDGLESLQDYLAEDFILAQRMRAAGRTVVISAAPVDRVAVSGGARAFTRRYIRWNAMRRTIAGPAYALEILANPTFLAMVLVGVTLATGGPERPTIVMAAIAVGAKMALDAGSQLLLGTPLKPRHVFLTPVRDLLLAYAWAAGFWSRSVTWRGTRVSLGPGSLLSRPSNYRRAAVRAGEHPPATVS